MTNEEYRQLIEKLVACCLLATARANVEFPSRAGQGASISVGCHFLSLLSQNLPGGRPIQAQSFIPLLEFELRRIRAAADVSDKPVAVSPQLIASITDILLSGIPDGPRHHRDAGTAPEGHRPPDDESALRDAVPIEGDQPTGDGSADDGVLDS